MVIKVKNIHSTVCVVTLFRVIISLLVYVIYLYNLSETSHKILQEIPVENNVMVRQYIQILQHLKIILIVSLGSGILYSKAVFCNLHSALTWLSCTALRCAALRCAALRRTTVQCSEAEKCRMLACECDAGCQHGAVFTINCAIFSVHCSIFHSHWLVLSVHCEVFSVHFEVFRVYCAVFIVHCKIINFNCAVFSVQRKLVWV